MHFVVSPDIVQHAVKFFHQVVADLFLHLSYHSFLSLQALNRKPLVQNPSRKFNLELSDEVLFRRRNTEKFEVIMRSKR